MEPAGLPGAHSNHERKQFRPPAFCSFDVEVDGPHPLAHSMRSIGIALYTERDGLLDTFYVHLKPQVDHQGTPFEPDPDTMRFFWNLRPEEWAHVNTDALEPREAMGRLADWMRTHQTRFTLKWVAKPSNCDWMWLKPYYEQYGPPDRPKLGHYCHDLSSLLRAYEIGHNIVDKKAWMNSLSNNAPYTHNALDDAICQGNMYMNLRKLLPQHDQYSYVATNRNGRPVLVTLSQIHRERAHTTKTPVFC